MWTVQLMTMRFITEITKTINECTEVRNPRSNLHDAQLN